MFYLFVRWDFRLHANRNPGNYWMHFRGLVDCEHNNAQAYVIIHYEGAAYLGNWPKNPLSGDNTLRHYSYQPNVRKFNQSFRSVTFPKAMKDCILALNCML